MTRAAVLVLALGCGTGAVPAGPVRSSAGGASAAASAPAVSPLSYLGDEFERVFPGRVRLARYGALRLAAGDAAPAIAGHGEGGEAIDLSQSPSLVVVDSRGERLRVVAQEGDYRLLLWIDERDLNWVIVDAVDVAFEPGEPAAAPPAPGVRLRPGLPVVRGDQRGSLVFVSHEDQCMSVAGWVPAARLGRQFTPVEELEVERDLSAGPGMALKERPSGRELARFLSECHVAYGGREESGQKLVVYDGNGFEARGWISGSAASPGASASLFGYGRGLGSFGASGDRVLIPSGSCLYASAGGPVVGVATEDTEEGGLQAGEHGWHSITVATGWGDLTVWVEEDGAAAEGSEPEVVEESGLLGTRRVKQMRLKRCR
jgi:hypothetical protein